MKPWPEHPNRVGVMMITDGIDRASLTFEQHHSWSSASTAAQRTGMLVCTIYDPAVGHGCIL
jgi:hypothetical protein